MLSDLTLHCDAVSKFVCRRLLLEHVSGAGEGSSQLAATSIPKLCESIFNISPSGIRVSTDYKVTHKTAFIQIYVYISTTGCV
mmetsp:Transcript_19629/g.23862  ORF Transcript_19629/g.23862 Transcript_19629/m.23862 type:complete len:83 (-) Transcript_19629:28-276(-)